LRPDSLLGVSHRLVHGGRHREPERVTPSLLDEVRRFVPVVPKHLPQALDAIDAVGREMPGLPQVACFDTAFHRSLPREARLFALPRRFIDAGVVRYGFHGLSCESILDALRVEDEERARGRLVIAHLGSGASLTAVKGGESVDTTMGFTPTGGIVMGTRSGDLDPGVLVWAMREEGLDAEGFDRLVNDEAGLAGLSGIGADMRDLLDREGTHPGAADAVALFCRSAKQAIGRLVAVLGGLDILVFTGGIGEHAPRVRERIVSGLECFGLSLDQAANESSRTTISVAGAGATIRVIASDEDAVLARHAMRLLAGRGIGRNESCTTST